MRDGRRTLGVVGGVTLLAMCFLLLVPTIFAQQARTAQDRQEAIQQAQYQQKLQQILNDKAGYVAAIVQRWEDSAREIGRWDENYAADLTAALMRLQPDNLLAAGEASSFPDVMMVLATGRRAPTGGPDVQFAAQPISPESLGSDVNDLVFTPVAPCRIVDTRLAGGAIAAGTTRTFDADGSTFVAQGGVATSCGVPYGASRAVAMTVTVTETATPGWVTAWGLGAMPLSSVLNYATSDTVANTTIVPIVPGAGNDFSIWTYANAQIIIDVVGYYAAPVATALDCTNLSSAVTAVPVNVWTSIDVFCPAGRTATGGGYDVPSEGTLGYPGVWITSLPITGGWRVWVDNQASGPRSVQAWATCCRIPGR